MLLGDAEYRPDYGPLYAPLSSNALWVDGVFVYDWTRSGGTAENLPVNPKKAPKIPLPASHAANESRLQQAA